MYGEKPSQDLPEFGMTVANRSELHRQGWVFLRSRFCKAPDFVMFGFPH